MQGHRSGLGCSSQTPECPSSLSHMLSGFFSLFCVWLFAGSPASSAPRPLVIVTSTRVHTTAAETSSPAK